MTFHLTPKLPSNNNDNNKTHLFQVCASTSAKIKALCHHSCSTDQKQINLRSTKCRPSPWTYCLHVCSCECLWKISVCWDASSSVSEWQHNQLLLCFLYKKHVGDNAACSSTSSGLLPSSSWEQDRRCWQFISDRREVLDWKHCAKFATVITGAGLLLHSSQPQVGKMEVTHVIGLSSLLE